MFESPGETSLIYRAYCPYCDKNVVATTPLGRDELKHALDSDAAIEVVHLQDGKREHTWNLDWQGKRHLRMTLK